MARKKHSKVKQGVVANHSAEKLFPLATYEHFWDPLFCKNFTIWPWSASPLMFIVMAIMIIIIFTATIATTNLLNGHNLNSYEDEDDRYLADRFSSHLLADYNAVVFCILYIDYNDNWAAHFDLAHNNHNQDVLTDSYHDDLGLNINRFETKRKRENKDIYEATSIPRFTLVTCNLTSLQSKGLNYL
uniref:Uncharacterized protein n=1 Tax=Glossina palpalis gambiensis TaxID=67801 RepID=A0A1B0AML8_9MUSC